jgi:hypothetical protein
MYPVLSYREQKNQVMDLEDKTAQGDHSLVGFWE